MNVEYVLKKKVLQVRKYTNINSGCAIFLILKKSYVGVKTEKMKRTIQILKVKYIFSLFQTEVM